MKKTKKAKARLIVPMDELDAFIAERMKRNPEFPKLLAEAERRLRARGAAERKRKGKGKVAANGNGDGRPRA